MAVALSTSTLRDLGDIKTLPKKEKMFLKKGLKNKTLFPVLPTPDEGSWLTVHPEIKQTYDSWQSMFRRIIERVRGDKKQICLVPLGTKWIDSRVQVDENGEKESFLLLLQRFAQIFFSGFEVKVLPSVSIEKLGCKTRQKSGHCQLYIPDIYKYFRSHWPRDAFCVVGITMSDLYPSESFQFVFGQANYSDGIGVFSFARYDPLFYTERSKSSSKTSSMPCTSPLVLWRSCKVMAHEISHLLCLLHCIYFSCGMNGSNSLEESNARPMFFCPVCLHKLQSSLGFRLKERYEALLAFCQSISDENFATACQWLEEAIGKFS